jgi:hypothetical protein
MSSPKMRSQQSSKIFYRPHPIETKPLIDKALHQTRKSTPNFLTPHAKFQTGKGPSAVPNLVVIFLARKDRSTVKLDFRTKQYGSRRAS